MDDNKQFWERFSRHYSGFMRRSQATYQQICKAMRPFLKRDMDVLEMCIRDRDRDVEHRKGEYGQNYGQSRDTANNIEHGIGHPASVVFAMATETNFCLLITLLLHLIFLLLFNICVQFVYGCFSFAFRQTKEAMP